LWDAGPGWIDADFDYRRSLSAILSWNSIQRAKRTADRSPYLETQKLLLEVNRQSIADPWLWSADDHPVRSGVDYDTHRGSSGIFQAKPLALAHLILTMFGFDFYRYAFAK
jgi:hypothetical protein